MVSRGRIRRAPHLTVLVAGGAAIALSLGGCSSTDTTEKASSVSSATSTSAAKAAPSASAAPSAKAPPSAKAVPSAKAHYEQTRKSVAAAKGL